MDWATCHPVFLFLAWLQAVAAHVEPPTNVTLQCHNLVNVLQWSYGQLSPGLGFRVDIGSTGFMKGYPNKLWITPPAPLQANVSFLSDPSMDYFLTVTAVTGQNESESDSAPHHGITFSYFKDSLANQKCFVDFPSVNITAQQDDTILLRFTHPWLVYNLPSSPNTKPRKKKSHSAQFSQLPAFHYDVVIMHQKERHHRLDCVESVCEETLAVDPAQKKHCVKMSGELQKILVKGTRDYCALPFEERPSYLALYCVMAGLTALGAVALVLYMVYRKMTTPSIYLPKSMTFTSKLKKWTSGAVREPVCDPEVLPASPTPLLSPGEEEPTTTVIPDTEPVLRLRLGVPAEEDVADVVEVVNDEGGNADVDEAQCSAEVSSGYERRPVVVVELAPGELAEGYRG